MLIGGLLLRDCSLFSLLHHSCTESKRLCNEGDLGSLLIVVEFVVTTCCVLRATCNVLLATCNLLRATCYVVLRVTLSLTHTHSLRAREREWTCYVLRATCYVHCCTVVAQNQKDISLPYALYATAFCKSRTLWSHTYYVHLRIMGAGNTSHYRVAKTHRMSYL